MIKWFTFVLAGLGLAMGIWTVATSGQEDPEPPPAAPPSVNPFASGIAGTGVVEAATRNIEIAAPEQGLVTDVHVQVNDRVNAGAPLFRIDTRELEAQLAVAQAQVKVEEAQAQYESLQLDRVKQVVQRGAGTPEELARQQAVYDAATARLEQARANVQALQTQIARRTMKAPTAGTILKRNIEPGEYIAPGGGSRRAAMVLGDIDTLHIRAQIDEVDTPRLRAGAEAVARVRGGFDIQVPLEMLRIEPLAQPKTQLTGESAELVDTRVVEVLFRVEGDLPIPLYPGQLVDVFIDAPDPRRGPSPALPRP